MANDPHRYGSFSLHEQLGAGGAGTVHRASWTDPVDGDTVEVALKRLHPHLAERPTVVNAFLNEARLVASLEHRNVCRFFDAGRIGGQYYIALEYISGVKLSSILRQASIQRMRPPVEVVIYLTAQLCDALDHVHGARDRVTGKPLRIVHRDVSPSNIVISDMGELKLIDFGIAKSRWSAAQTQIGAIKGTYGYLPPEAVCGVKADASADVFAAGIIAWELLTARPLFGGAKNELEALDRAFACQVPPPSELNPECPPALESVILRALARNWRDRWSSMAAMAKAIRSVAATLELAPSMAGVSAWVQSVMEGAEPEPAPSRPTTRRDYDEVILLTETPATGVWSRPPEPPTGERPRFARGTGPVPELIDKRFAHEVCTSNIETSPFVEIISGDVNLDFDVDLDLGGEPSHNDFALASAIGGRAETDVIQTMSPRARIYWLLCIIGAAIPAWQVVIWLAGHGTDVSAAAATIASMRLSAPIGLDVVVSAVVVLLSCTPELRRRSRIWWVPIAGTVAVGVGFGLPLALYLRETTRLHGRRAGSAGYSPR